ncbi:MAG: metal ABC transporter substrate-binding protein [Bacilli bacterium]
MKCSKIFTLLIGFILIISLFLTACGGQNTTRMNSSNNNNGDKVSIYTSFYPLYDFASKIAGERANVVNLVPPGAEPHDFEPTPKDLVKLSEADIFVYNGSGFETWIEDVLDSLDTTKLDVLNVSEHVDLLSLEETGGEVDHQHDEEHGDEHADEHKDEDHGEKNGHEGEDNDPHLWLDPIRAKQMASTIKDALVKIDSEGTEIYEANYNTLITELDKLHSEFEAVVKNSNRKEMIVSHSAFGYLANRYGLKQIAISGISPSDEPSQKELQEIISFAKKHNVKYILFETLVSGKVADVVKNQIGAEAITLNTLEGLTKEELSNNKDYFSVMRDNLNSLKKALDSK